MGMNVKAKQLIWQKIHGDLIQKIEQNIYSPGEYLPTEFELMRHYHVSRQSVRRALQELVQRGYIERSTRRGSLVIYTPHDHFYHHKASTITTLDPFRNIAPRDLRIIQIVNTQDLPVAAFETEKLHHIVFLRNERAQAKQYQSLTLAWFAYQDQSFLYTLQDNPQTPLIKLLRKKLNTNCYQIQQTVRAIQANTTLSHYWPQCHNMPFLEIERKFFDSKGSIILYTLNYYNDPNFSLQTNLEQSVVMQNP